jgi:hypothetical protein
MLPRTTQALIQLREVELVFLWLDLFPSDTPKNSVEIRFSQLRPRFCHVLGRCEGRVLELAGTHQERLAIDDELLGRWCLSEVRDVDLHAEVAILQAKVSGVGCNASQVWDGEEVVIGLLPTFANNPAIQHPRDRVPHLA